jgi:DNA-binding CsgD family transcriptional regulator
MQQTHLTYQDTDEDEVGVGYDFDAALDIDPDEIWRLNWQNPNCRYVMASGRMDVVVQFSDFVSTRQLHALELYQLCFQPGGIEHLMTVPLPGPPGRVRCYAFTRGSGPGFSETERMIATLLQPHLYQIYKDAARRRTPVQLTGRQLDVLRCVALGMSNDQIVAELVIAAGTVTKHLESAYAWLGVTSRTAALARVFGDPEPAA